MSNLWSSIIGTGGLGLLVLAFLAGVRWERRRVHGPDRTYRIVIVDETLARPPVEDDPG